MGKKSYKHPRQYNTETFKTRLYEIYGDKFGLDLVKYNGAYKPIKLVCPIHGEFETRACTAARGNASCKKCSAISKRLNSRIPFEKIITRILNKHPDFLIDENQEYVSTHTNINITCPIHGNFKMTPNDIFNGQSCPKCGRESMKRKRSHNIDWLIKESNKIHGDKYSFEHFVYKNTKTKSYVTCKKHGDFLISADKLIYGKSGCPHCSSSKLETSLKMLLEENNEEFIHRCDISIFPWLKNQHLDFYLPKQNIAIECQGIQHYEPTRFGGMTKEKAIEQLKYVKELDKRKRKLCKEHNIKLLYLKYDDNINEFYKSIVNK